MSGAVGEKDDLWGAVGRRKLCEGEGVGVQCG